MIRQSFRLMAGLVQLVLIGGCFSAGGGSSTPAPRPPVEPDPGSDPLAPRSRYSFNNDCFVLYSTANGQYVAVDGAGYAATSADIANAEAFYFKPSALGDYLLYNRSRQLVTAAAPVSNSALAVASDNAIWTVSGVGDGTAYPARMQYNSEPTPEQIVAYRDFADPLIQASAFTLVSAGSGQALAVDEAGVLTTAAAEGSAAESFRIEPVTACEQFPEAQSNVIGKTFSGTTADGRVLGMADAHVHITASEFLGGGQWGYTVHKYGVTHALGSCESLHGPGGSRDVIGAFLGSDFDGHDTTGWPTFPEWPARDALTHEAIYWKWLERSWQAGLRIAVNDLVDNQTLCELQRSNSNDPTRDCDPMNSVGGQAGSSYVMQDYIDAQYGGPGAGWFRIVLDAGEARTVIEDGKLAVVLSIEISNFLNCQLNYSPLSMEEAMDETGVAPGNSYGCAMTETGADNEVLTQLNRLWDLGVRHVISIHEFDNALGGNGLFYPILNLGTRENSGGIPSGTIAGPFETDPESPTGEFWTTYTCPAEDEPGFSGYLFGDSGGTVLSNPEDGGMSPPACVFAGRNGRPGGQTLCYPAEPQCNARWMTPLGLYTFSRMMEMGFMFNFDHFELEMKTQALELSEAQPIAYPFVSTHGTFGGTTLDQASRVLRNGGLIYPSLGNGPQHIEKMTELLTVYDAAMLGVAEADRPLFGFGFGTDTNGLSDQSPPRGNIEAGKEIVYPYTLFSGAVFDQLPDFDNIGGVVFEQPTNFDPDGNGRTWHLDVDGSAHHGMLSGLVQEMRLEGTPEQMQHLFNSAEAFLRTWERTEQASGAIVANGGTVDPGGILRAAPTP